MRRCAHLLASRLSVGVLAFTSRIGCGGDAAATAQGVAPTAMGRGVLRVPWRCVSTSGNSSSGSGGIRGSGEKSAQLWTMESSVRDILLHQSFPELGKMGLREFVREYVNRDYPIEQMGNYTMDVVVTNSNRFIPEELREDIESLEAFQQLRDAHEDRKQTRKDARLLEQHGVVTLRQWRDFGEQDIVSPRSRGILNGVEVQNTEILQEGQVLTGVYESIYDASWSYVVKSPDGVSDRFWLEVKDGSFPPQEWTDEEVDYLTHNVDTETADSIGIAREEELMEDKDNLQPTQERVVMKVLTSPKGWPYGLHEDKPLCDFFLTKEVERAWRVVRDDLRDWFEAEPRVLENSRQRVLIGTPGIGKSMAFGSYLLHQLLHYDAKILPVVAYFIGNETYIFNKTTKQVTVYDNVMGLAMVKRLAQAKNNGYTIYDCSKITDGPPRTLPVSWGTVLISSPDEKNFKEWAKQKIASNFIINCPEDSDIKAMCAWKMRAQLDGLKDYWEVIMNRISNVGPILRFLFDDKAYDDRVEAVDGALRGIKPETVAQYYDVDRGELWRSDKPTHKIVKITRLVRKSGSEIFFNEPICPKAEEEIQKAVSKAINTDAAQMAVLLPLHELIPRVLETFGVKAFMNKNFVERILPKLTVFLPEKSERSGKPCVLCESIGACPDDMISVPLKSAVTTKTNVQFKKLYRPSSKYFPVLDGFFFVSGQPNTIVGIQVTKSENHDTTTSKVKALREYLAAFFSDWEEISKDLSWEIIYVQFEDSVPMKRWQKCASPFEKVSNDESSVNKEPKKVTKKKRGKEPKATEEISEEVPKATEETSKSEHDAIAIHWNKKVHQYHLIISSSDVRDNK